VRLFQAEAECETGGWKIPFECFPNRMHQELHEFDKERGSVHGTVVVMDTSNGMMKLDDTDVYLDD